MRIAACLLLLAAIAPSLFAQDGLTVEVAAVAEGKAEPGKEYTLKLRFTVPEGYHAYHKDNPGYSLPIDVKWKELSGLELVSATWPEPVKHKDDTSEEWELNGTFDIVYAFKVPADAKGSLSVTGSHKTQFCDAQGCMMSEGDFSATIEVAEASADPKKPAVGPGPGPGPIKKKEPTAKASAKFEGEAKAGGQATLNVTLEFTKGYHAYHKDNPGYGLPPVIKWTELAGLKLASETWPEPIKHEIEKDWIEWEYESGVTLSYVFDVPKDAAGELKIAGAWEAQICDADACFTFDGKLEATLDVAAPAEDKSAKDSHGFYLDFNYAVKQSMELDKPLLVDFNGEY